VAREFNILHAPSPLGLKPPADGRIPGVRHMPEALRRAGLHEALGSTTYGTVQPPEYVPDLDPELRVRNPDAIAAYSVELADAVEPLLNQPAFLLVLGGDCSIFIGTALAMRRAGRFGVIYIDGHSDCQSPEVSQTGGVAGMPLAIATGRGVRMLSDLEGRRPYLADEDVVVLGLRDLFDVIGTGDKTIAGTQIRVRDLGDIRSSTPERVATDALVSLTSRRVDGVWVHLDVDVLDPQIMPAVDSPDPGGLFADELTALLRPLLAAPVVRGMQITIYDPERDPDGKAAQVLVDTLGRSLQRYDGGIESVRYRR
jgi:arginase